MVVLDTDLLTLLHGPPSAARDRLVDWLEAGDEAAVTILSFEEQFRGWLSYISRVKDVEKQVVAYGRLHRLIERYATLTILDFTGSAASLFQSLRTKYRRAGRSERGHPHI